MSSVPVYVDSFSVCALKSFDGRYTLVSRPFISMAQCSLSLCFRWRGGMGGFFRSGGGGRTPSSSCMRRATSGGMCSGLPSGGGGWKLPLFCWQFGKPGLVTGFVSQMRGTYGETRKGKWNNSFICFTRMKSMEQFTIRSYVLALVKSYVSI